MTLTSLEAIIKALNEHQVRYLIVGGLAVAAHGYGRFTLDVDLVVQLDLQNAERTLRALQSLGYVPAVPASLDEFTDEQKRATWAEQKHMVVFPLRSEQHPLTPVDLFIVEPFDFAREYDRAFTGQISAQEVAHFVCLETLIAMKEATGREKDKEDVRQLRLIREDSDEH